jgi:hypothetical protein
LTEIYFGDGVIVRYSERSLRSPRDFHLFQVREGVRMLFMRPVSGSVIDIDLGAKIKLVEPAKTDVDLVTRRFWLEVPWHSRKAPVACRHFGRAPLTVDVGKPGLLP